MYKILVMVVRSVSSCFHGIRSFIIAQVRSYSDPFRNILCLNISFLAVYFNIIHIILDTGGVVLYLFLRLGRSH
jgi:hypothetical protein